MLQVMQDVGKITTSPAQYFKACRAEEVLGYTYWPFWDELPFPNIHLSITSEVLHQLYQGVLKHLIT